MNRSYALDKGLQQAGVGSVSSRMDMGVPNTSHPTTIRKAAATAWPHAYSRLTPRRWIAIVGGMMVSAACGSQDPGPGQPSTTGGSAVGGGSSVGGSASGQGGTSGSAGGSNSAGGSDSAGGSSTPSGGAGAGGSSGTSAGPCGERPTGAMLPFATGYQWTYKVTDTQTHAQTQKVTTVQGKEPVGYGTNKDLVVYKVLTTKKDNTDQTISWQDTVDDKVVRYREDSFAASDKSLKETDYWVPYRLHIDGSPEHSVANASWKDSYAETKMPVGGTASRDQPMSDTWTVVSDYECIDVPAGTGLNGPVAAGKYPAVVYRKDTGNVKTYWYVRGIGKVREEGTGQTEELVGFSLTAQ